MNCPRCKYPELPHIQGKAQGTYIQGQHCPHCNFLDEEAVRARKAAGMRALVNALKGDR